MIQTLRLLLLSVLVVLAACEATPVRTSTTALPASTENKLARLNTQLGIGYLREGNLKLAWQKLKRALDEDPGFSTAHNAMGLLQQRLGSIAEAEDHFKTAVSLNPSDSAAQTNFGSLLCATGRYAEGIQRFLNALKNPLYDRPELAYNNAGQCSMVTGDFDAAGRYFRAALERNPKIPTALLNMSNINFRKQRYLPARAYIQRYQEVGKRSAKSIWLRVRIERKLGDKPTAARYALILEKQFPDSREAGLLEETPSQ